MSGRDVLSGIFHHLETIRGGWNTRIFQEEINPLTPHSLRVALADGIDGIILTKECSTELMNAISKCNLPTVCIGFDSHHLKGVTRLSYIKNDPVGIGKLAASHLTSRGGVSTFGFIGTPWSGQREAAFRHEIERLGFSFHPFIPKGQLGSPEDKQALVEYLRRLPKPAGLLSAADWRAEQVMSTCSNMGIRIPQDVAVLGIDNDEFICPHTQPPLSSVHPGHFEMGYRAMDELIRLNKARKPSLQPRSIVIPTRRICIRESTEIRATGAAIVSRAKLFIAANACRNITVRDVAQSLHVSYRLAALRFKESEGITIGEAIETVRLNKVKNMLANTNRKVIQIAAECGYNNPNHLSHIFRKRFGISLRSYRAASKSVSGQRIG